MDSTWHLEISETEKKTLLRLARKTLEYSFQNCPEDAIQELPQPLPPCFQKELGCFVSLVGPRDRLRGCIGHLECTQPLYRSVHSLAMAAAFEDTRFRPVEKEELHRVHIHISVLGPLSPAKSLEEVQVGRHGLVVSQDNRRGVLLASVATQYGWNRETFFHETCRKAGVPPTDFAHVTVHKFEELDFSEQ